jgi:hypothetical protein
MYFVARMRKTQPYACDMFRFILTASLFASCFFGFGQNRLNKLVQSLKSADSVWVVSHSETVGIIIKDEKGNRISQPLVENGKLNNRTIKERYLLNDSEINNLSIILGRPKKDIKIEMANCFIPFHALIWKSKGQLFWIEIAFNCTRVDSCKEFPISESDFDTRKWNELTEFYKQKGISYNL